MEKLLDQREVAEILGLSDRTLEAWRVQGYGPAHLRLSPSRIRYRPSDIQAWIDAQERSSTSDPGSGEASR